MKIDIRDNDNEPITQIYFEDNEYIYQEGDFISICDGNYGQLVDVHKSNIDNLIKALQKPRNFGMHKSTVELFWDAIRVKFGNNTEWHNLEPAHQHQFIQGVNMILNVCSFGGENNGKE